MKLETEKKQQLRDSLIREIVNHVTALRAGHRDVKVVIGCYQKGRNRVFAIDYLCPDMEGFASFDDVDRDIMIKYQYLFAFTAELGNDWTQAVETVKADVENRRIGDKIDAFIDTALSTRLKRR